MSDTSRHYHTVEYQQACTQIVNDLSSLFFEDGRVDLGEIEMIVIKNLEQRFTRTALAELAGISIRTVRNKLNPLKQNEERV